MFKRLRILRRRWRNWRPLGRHPTAQWTWVQARRVIVAVIGGTLVVLGTIMFVTPGPALVVIPLGLGVLGVEFVWALRLQRRVAKHASQAVGKEGVLQRWWRKLRGASA